MRKKKKVKQVLIKRTFYSKNFYDYLWKDEKTAKNIIAETNDGRKRDYRFEKAGNFITLGYKIKRFIKNENFAKFIWLVIGTAIGILGKFIYDWINT